MKEVELLESNEDNFSCERTFLTVEGGALVPRAIMGGSLCNIESKETLLDAGIAFCQPIDGTSEQSWPVSVRVRKNLYQGELSYEETLWNCTGNIRIVQAAREFNAWINSIKPRLLTNLIQEIGRNADSWNASCSRYAEHIPKSFREFRQTH